MNIIEKIRQRILRFLKIEQLPYNPYGERFTYVNDFGEEKRYRMKEAQIWLRGDSNELLNFYTNQEVYGFSKNPVYNRNRLNYFWAQSAMEPSMKRVHSGLAKAMVETLTNAVGVPTVTVDGDMSPKILDDIHFTRLLNQQQIPQTLGVGWGAFKVSFDPTLSKHPIVSFYKAEDVEFVTKKGIDVGIIYKNYYTVGKRDYLLLETRRIDEEGSSCIEYELFEIRKGDEIAPCDMSEVPELANLKNVKIPGYRHILGVPCRFFRDEDNPDYGRSIFDGKYDLMDDLDQSLSQRSQTCKVSTPVEYYPSDLLRFDKNGRAQFPQIYNRQFVQKPGGAPDGDGNSDGAIQTTQPQLNFDQYTSEQMAIVSQILIGILSPATMGIDVAKKDNADAQREKEKVTTMTRDNVIASEKEIVRDLVSLCVDVEEYLSSGSISLKEHQISVKFPQFASPSFETMSQILTPMWAQGAISTRMYVDKLYGDSLSKEEKEAEISWLDSNRQQEQAQAFMGGFDEEGNGFPAR